MNNPISVFPAIALRGTTILPEMIVHFDVSRERSIHAIEAAMMKDQKIFLFTQKDPEMETPGALDLYQIGTVAYIKQVIKLPQNLLRVLVEGKQRARLLDFVQEEPFIEVQIAETDNERAALSPAVEEAMHQSLQQLFHQYCMESGGRISKVITAQIMTIKDVEAMITQIGVNLPLSYQDKQKILDAVTLEEQYEVIGTLLSNEIEVCKITKELQRRLKARVDKNQREYILREQMKLIREELGEENTSDMAEEYRQKLSELSASEEVK